MKQRFSILWRMLLGLVLVLCAVGLGGCSDDDFDMNGILKGDVYQGVITDVSTEYGWFHVRVMHSPFKTGKLNKPSKEDIIVVEQKTCANFELKKGQRLAFRIIHVEKMDFSDILVPCYMPNDWWEGEIEIFGIK